MAQFYKHVGRIVNSDRRCVVAFRELPNDSKNCLVIDTDALPDRFHDGVMTAVENQIAQETVEFYKYLQRNSFIDGSNMLTALHNKGWLVKQPTENVVMLPAPNQKISLVDLNDQLRKLGFDVYADEEDAKQTPSEQVLETVAPTATTIPDSVKGKEALTKTISNEDLAKDFMAQADKYFEEAEKLKEQALGLDKSLGKKARGRPKKSD